MKRRKRNNFLQVVATIGAMILVAAAIQDQLRLPADERTWHGTIWGFPYDFRVPTLARIRERFWNKDTAAVLTPHVFGVGWSINFYPLVHPQAQ